MTDLLMAPSGNRGPAPDLGVPLLEVVTQPLYSAIAFDGAILPNEVRAFQYQIGDTVAGAGTGAIAATLLHTNMEQAGALSTPKVFEVFGVRMVVGNIDAPLTVGTPQPATIADPAMLEDTQRLFGGVHIALHVGTKDYVSGPAWLFPGNCGIGGLSASGIFDTVALEQIQMQAVQGQGKYMGLNPYTVFIPSQQSFHVKVRSPQTTTPTVSTDRTIWIMLDGRIGREAQ